MEIRRRSTTFQYSISVLATCEDLKVRLVSSSRLEWSSGNLKYADEKIILIIASIGQIEQPLQGLRTNPYSMRWK